MVVSEDAIAFIAIPKTRELLHPHGRIPSFDRSGGQCIGTSPDTSSFTSHTSPVTANLSFSSQSPKLHWRHTK